MTTEVVLPSGQFARLSPITTGDVAVASQASSGFLMVVWVAARCVTLVGERLSADQWLALEYEDFAPIQHMILNTLQAISRNGVA